ncbi:DddA-like double-stranded DNA deaminase toxin [Kineosporia sp. NBRC 101731]|uniref:DddA-like double-stranded DNA deaminase toxin n=1 Tax=Kineosporia sp. NBRC 101731 TaxID=3032199 RepID=UPI0024A5E5FA|nr:DddA-like double-stranded DNA deaminase toxin [Kineosporia sp. NBRC 101731]GLY29819.1 hypothetical protein Kisp02_31840 [Kineosporia sp. NBRC 101731]
MSQEVQDHVQSAALEEFAQTIAALRENLHIIADVLEKARAEIDVELQVLKSWKSPDPSGPDETDAGAAGAFVRAVREAADALPVRVGNVGKTTGLVLDMRGRRASGGPIVSGRDPTLIDDLVLSPREALADPLKSHVEAYVARGVRRGDFPREIVLVLNNRPCFGPNGCDQWLPRILPAGVRMHVYVADDRPLRLHKTYEGHGRRIRQ